MKNYRAAFLLALLVNLALFAAVAALWRRHSATEPAIAPPSHALEAAAGAHSGLPPPAPASQPLAPIQLSPERLQSIGARIGVVRRQSLTDRIRTTGDVAVDETQLAYVQVRFSGYIQQVFVDSTYRYVRRGEPLFTIYSPELLATEREYLVARMSQQRLAHSPDPAVVADAASLVDAAAERLAQWGIPRREIERLQATRRARRNLTIDSPASGFVTEREALPNAFVQPGTRLYTVANLATIWVFAHVFQSDLGRLEVGDPSTLTVDTYPGRKFKGRVDFIYPDIDPKTRTARVRLIFPNPTLKLVPGMFVNVSLGIPMGDHVVIPASGVLQTGARQIVFLDRGGGHLEPRDVQLGAEVGDEYIVLAGLEPGERIVTSANFLIDSESQLQGALGSFTPPTTNASGAGATRIHIAMSTQPTPVRVGSNLIRVLLTDAKGAPLSGAQVSVTFAKPAMPQMGMAGQRVSVSLQEVGAGTYQGSGTLPAGGAWQAAILARQGGQVIASEQLSVDAAGGM
ncbi:MAG: efflux RND transporter periplasmic adaptor subunit [Proteobacteria bacterium]|nr:efflux RND transporter periplasmic adaptor subunit [Pseudomonadota bacterium]